MDNLDKLKAIIRTLIEQGVELEEQSEFVCKTVDFTKKNRPETKKEIENYFNNL